MKTFVNNSFTGHELNIGTAAVVVAPSRSRAAEILKARLAKIGLPQDVNAKDMREVKTDSEQCEILNDGDY